MGKIKGEEKQETQEKIPRHGLKMTREKGGRLRGYTTYDVVWDLNTFRRDVAQSEIPIGRLKQSLRERALRRPYLLLYSHYEARSAVSITNRTL